jgi:hypothetical protein
MVDRSLEASIETELDELTQMVRELAECVAILAEHAEMFSTTRRAKVVAERAQ